MNFSINTQIQLGTEKFRCSFFHCNEIKWAIVIHRIFRCYNGNTIIYSMVITTTWYTISIKWHVHETSRCPKMLCNIININKCLFSLSLSLSLCVCCVYVMWFDVLHLNLSSDRFHAHTVFWNYAEVSLSLYI